MTPEAQRIAIAEACGWKKWSFDDPFLEGLKLADQKFNGYIRIVTRVYPDGVTLNVDESPLFSFEKIKKDFIPVNFWKDKVGRWWPNPPDYLNNLNAMHEAEKVLTGPDSFPEYVRILSLICNVPEWACVSATAAQRAEAFLRTIGKWEE